jgi:hypothetical protein
MYWVIQNIKESNHVSAIPLSENNWDGIICVLENVSNPNWEKSAASDGHAVDERAVLCAIELSAERYFLAQGMLSKVAPINLEYQIY